MDFEGVLIAGWEGVCKGGAVGGAAGNPGGLAIPAGSAGLDGASLEGEKQVKFGEPEVPVSRCRSLLAARARLNREV